MGKDWLGLSGFGFGVGARYGVEWSLDGIGLGKELDLVWGLDGERDGIWVVVGGMWWDWDMVWMELGWG